MATAADSPALWPSERGKRAGVSTLNRRFSQARDALGLPAGLDFHSLRRSYVTHLLEDGWDPLFVQHQVGHEYASTTALYSACRRFPHRTLRRALDATMTAALQQEGRSDDDTHGRPATSGGCGKSWPPTACSAPPI
jgi:site-specific recombinase XerC